MKNRSLPHAEKLFTTETRRHGEHIYKKVQKLKKVSILSLLFSGLTKKLFLVSSVSPCLRGDRSFRLVSSIVLTLALFLNSCTLAKVDVNVVSERTSLENQVLGTYNSLSEDMLLVASVRGVSPTGTIEAPPRHTPEQVDATRALETIAFHADDVESFKRFGWVGENREGLLTPFTREPPKTASEEQKSFAANYSEAEFQQVVQEVNQAREALMMRVVQTNENFTIKDLPAIHAVFAKINRQNSVSGAKVQNADGTWMTL
jgi:uncharacterized protein YdbL (DUF1318 family)